jgi:acyl dehydratase
VTCLPVTAGGVGLAYLSDGPKKTTNGGRMDLPGLEELKPVYPGDSLSLTVEVVDKRVPKSRPEIGSVKIRSCVFNQNEAIVSQQIATFIHPRRHCE